MEIAPGFTGEEWRKLSLDDSGHHDWQRAVDVLRDRLWKRYVEPVNMLICNEPLDPTERAIGFTVLAIDCLLVETYTCFRLGIVNSSGQSQRIFTTFLVKRPRFGSYFDATQAKRFYLDYRCGILHQAEIPSDCRIWSIGPLREERNGVTYVNRNAFHTELKAEIEEYLSELRAGRDEALRTHFRHKMDRISGL